MEITKKSVVPTIVYTRWMNQIRTMNIFNAKILCEIEKTLISTETFMKSDKPSEIAVIAINPICTGKATGLTVGGDERSGLYNFIKV